MLVRGCEFPEDRYYHADFNVWIKPESPGVALLGAGLALAGRPATLAAQGSVALSGVVSSSIPDGWCR